MYIIVNRSNGNLAHLPASGIINFTQRSMDLSEKTKESLAKLRPGEYVHWAGNCIVVGSAGGVTLEDLEKRPAEQTPDARNNILKGSVVVQWFTLEAPNNRPVEHTREFFPGNAVYRDNPAKSADADANALFDELRNNRDNFNIRKYTIERYASCG